MLGDIYGISTVRAANTIMLLLAITAQTIVSRHNEPLLPADD
jgi:hypothetical protein